MERSLARVLMVVVACCGCATAEDDLGIASYDAGSDSATGAVDTGRDSAVDDTPADSTTTDSAMADSATTDSATEDSGTVDTDIADSGTVVDTATTDTTPPVCGATDKYGPKCKTNADCTAIPTCGYVCCAFDPVFMTNLGCGRSSAGSICAP